MKRMKSFYCASIQFETSYKENDPNWWGKLLLWRSLYESRKKLWKYKLRNRVSKSRESRFTHNLERRRVSTNSVDGTHGRTFQRLSIFSYRRGKEASSSPLITNLKYRSSATWRIEEIPYTFPRTFENFSLPAAHKTDLIRARDFGCIPRPLSTFDPAK